jgi:hypothetical protein
VDEPRLPRRSIIPGETPWTKTTNGKTATGLNMMPRSEITPLSSKLKALVISMQPMAGVALLGAIGPRNTKQLIKKDTGAFVMID